MKSIFLPLSVDSKHYYRIYSNTIFFFYAYSNDKNVLEHFFVIQYSTSHVLLTCSDDFNNDQYRFYDHINHLAEVRPLFSFYFSKQWHEDFIAHYYIRSELLIK